MPLQILSSLLVTNENPWSLCILRYWSIVWQLLIILNASLVIHHLETSSLWICDVSLDISPTLLRRASGRPILYPITHNWTVKRLSYTWRDSRAQDRDRFLEIYRQTSPSERVMCARTFSNRCCWVHAVAVLQYLLARNGGLPIFTAWRDPSHGPTRRHFHDFPQQGSSFFARTIRDLDSQKSSRRATISRRVARASCERQRCGITGGVHMPARPPDPFHGEQTAAASGGPPPATDGHVA